MNLDGFVNIVDALGGVEMNVPYRLYYPDPAQNLYIDLYPGYQTLTGAEAEQFVRFRHGYLQADIGRQNAQKMFMSAFIQKAKSSLNISNVGTLTTVATEIIDNLTTDITVSDFVYFAKEMLENSDVPISEVCARSCFQSYAYFGRVFKQLNGMSPSEYRKAKRNTGISES